MHNIYDCIDSFISMLDTAYHFMLGRKGVSVTLDISFDKKDCFHLFSANFTAECSINSNKKEYVGKKRKLTGISPACPHIFERKD